MREQLRTMNTLWSFGRLLRKMRGTTSIPALAERVGFDAAYLESVETGRLRADEFVARNILQRGFELEEADIDRLILGIELYDLGLRDNDFRQLVIDLIYRSTPHKIQEQIRSLYRSYAA